MEQLSNATLGLVPHAVVTPSYDRSVVPTRIVHLGTGTFHRSHSAIYTDQVMQLEGPNWGIFATSIRNPALSLALAPQNGLYTVLVDDNDTRRARVIGSLNHVACLAQSRDEVINALVAPQTEIVTLTLGARGYGYDASHDGLDLSLPDVQLDLHSPQSAHSPIGVLAWAIFQRKLNGRPPLTLLSCDHLPANGKILQRVLEHYIDRVQNDLNAPDLLQYFLDQYACPCSLVDRTALAALPADISSAEALLSVHDAAPVVTEPFSQWIIQDWFSTDRPQWEKAGAVLVTHVAPFEQAQSIMLHAGHFALAHLGAVAGCKTLAQAMQHPEIARYIDDLLEDAIFTLPKHTRIDWDRYKQKLLRRFGNSAQTITTAQTTIDSSSVLVSGILEPLKIRMVHGQSIEHHATAVAAWMRYLTGYNERNEELYISDPLQDELLQSVRSAGGRTASAFDLVEALIHVRPIFGATLPKDLEFTRRVTAALQDIMDERVLGALKLLNSPNRRIRAS
jgi:fructuronate reductase